MLGIDALDIAVLLADAEMIEVALQDLMGRSQLLPLVEENKSVRGMVKSQLKRWKSKVAAKVDNIPHTKEIKQELALYQEVIHWSEAEFIAQIDTLLEQLQSCSEFYPDAKKILLSTNAKLNPMLPHYFCQQWYNSIVSNVRRIQESQLEVEKQEELEQLRKRLENIKQMEQLSPDEDTGTIAGRMWDMTNISLSKSDWSVMKDQADFLNKHPKLKDIAEQLGRMANQNDLNEPPSYSEGIRFEEENSQQATDDIVGIHENDDLNKLLPNELLFLTYPELEVVFYKHLIDKRLMNYQMEGKAHSSKKVTAMEPIPAKAENDTGPFIICVDASGSMRGFPEQCVKAIAFALMQIALAEDRDCYVVLFSTDYITYQLTKQDGLREASDFLSYTFHGGTDLEPAISEAIKQMQGERYQHADLVILSDFIAPKQSKNMIQQVEALKQKNNRFHAISLSKYGNPELMNIFDHVWSYTPSLGQKLVKQK
ncbi:ATPase RavA stimulator ViaA [Vibrio algivorus]|uniref:ATPase RavA stimulator ViaA n=1 Tax=Vibrio algivorus TaxID=1667024 RepID=A0A557P8T6_9VIBR|nr:ATPase RavA stimulator ViaA [Vibrio algivorus]TVO37064.1 ATPase RavA stimulator ViaA [Vibrio algivorus]